MLKSMTGFGKAVGNYKNKKITVETKSLNSKNLDLNIRTPSYYREKEMEVRAVAANVLQRGKSEVNIYVENIGSSSDYAINTELAKNYHSKLTELATLIGEKPENTLDVLIKMPEVVQASKEEIDEEEWKITSKIINEALEKLNEFRLTEGTSLKKDLQDRTISILNLLKKIEPLEEERIGSVKKRISVNLENAVGKDKVDNNRFEQELIYYLEKLDISEEKVRLKSHCNYFTEVLRGNQSQGKKLGFISQEMGREINTLGSKSNHAEMQKLVVQMKDELEKIKEQVLNVL